MLMPVFVLVCISVYFFLGRPILFRQVRPGRGGKPFEMIKFRSMKKDAKGLGVSSDVDRLTQFGKVLRSTSLDELPELWNVLKGDMSLVGPRPLLMHYLPLYSEYQMRRHEVRPGLTGLAQISGRNSLSWDERFELDVYYVDHRSFWLDIRILFRTLLVVVNRRGVNGAGSVSMDEYKGSSHGSK